MHIFSTHELDIALKMCDKVAVLDSTALEIYDAGELCDSGLIEQIFSINL